MRNLEMILGRVYFVKECLSCGRIISMEKMWSNIFQHGKRSYFCKNCCFDVTEANQNYMNYVVGPKPEVTPPPQRL